MAIKREKIQPKVIHVMGPASLPTRGGRAQRGGNDYLCRRATRLGRGGELRREGQHAAQIQQVGETIKTCPEAAGASLADIVKTNTSYGLRGIRQA
jgi:hypothetical protein